MTGLGSGPQTMSEESVQALLERAFAPLLLDARRVLVIIPDSTRTAPIPLLFRLLYEEID
jgi:hypothetical protein